MVKFADFYNMLLFLHSHSSRSLLLPLFIEGLLLTTFLMAVSRGYPDDTRMALWKEGGIKHFNSNPVLRIYFYANHKEPPPIPYIWARTSSDFNLAVGILSTWVLLARILLKYLTVSGKWTELFCYSCIFPFWIVSTIGQISADFTDPDHVSRSPWYLSVSCSSASSSAQTACRVAQTTFGITIVMIIFYWACIWQIVGFEIFKFWLKKTRVERTAVASTLQLSNYRSANDSCSDDRYLDDTASL